VISTQTDILPQHKLFLCGYAVLNRTVSVWYTLTVHRIRIELYTSLMTFKTFSTIQWSSIYDWLFATVMHVSRIVCVCYSTVNVDKCKQQWTELLLHMITIKFWKWIWIDSLLNRHFEYCLHELLHNYPSYNHNHIKLVKFSGGGLSCPCCPPCCLHAALLDLSYVWF
jgi:hypothetical protein